MEKYYKIKIEKNTGQITIEGEGFTGKSCIFEIENLMMKLGSVVETKYKPEYDMDETANLVITK